MNKPDKQLYCCGQPAKWVVQSIRLYYWFCESCREEVTEVSDKIPEASLEYKVNFSNGIGQLSGIRRSGYPPALIPTLRQHDWDNSNGICRNGCGVTVAEHANYGIMCFAGGQGINQPPVGAPTGVQQGTIPVCLHSSKVQYVKAGHIVTWCTDCCRDI